MRRQLASLAVLAAATVTMATDPAHAQGLTKAVGGAAGADSSSGGGGDTSALAVPEHKFYAGASYAHATLSVSDQPQGEIGTGKYTTTFVDIRAGYRVFNAIGLEAHYGVPLTDDDASGSHIKQSQYYAAFAVPTASVFSTFELGFPIGFVHSKVKHSIGGDRDSENFDSVAFGVNVEFPLRVVWEKLPDIRFTGGGKVYSQHSNARYYGYEGGLRYDFGF